MSCVLSERLDCSPNRAAPCVPGRRVRPAHCGGYLDCIADHAGVQVKAGAWTAARHKGIASGPCSAQLILQACAQVKANAWKAGTPNALQRLRELGMACFDAEFYIHTSPTEFGSFSPDQAWSHFLNFGYTEGRVHRMVC